MEVALPPTAALASRGSVPAVDAPAGATNAVAVERLSKRLGGRAILTEVSLQIGRGESVALIGANGAGKSTLLRLLVRLLEPDSGHVRILGDDMTAADRVELRQLRRRIGFVFQQHNLVGRASVLTNVVHGALGRASWLRAASHRLAPDALRGEAMHCLARVGLAAFASHRADRLSGGQSQRVAIARALMQRPALLLADEPAASLDPSAGDEVMRVFQRLVADDGITLVFTSHNLLHARSYAGRIVGLLGGRIAVDCPSANLDDRSADALYA